MWGDCPATQGCDVASIGTTRTGPAGRHRDRAARRSGNSNQCRAADLCRIFELFEARQVWFPEERRRCLRSRDRLILQKAQTFFQYGNDAALKSNFDYAIDMYKQACKLVPDNMVYRQALRGVETAQVQRRSEQGGDAGRCQESADPDARQVGAIEGQSHSRASSLCEDAFVNNPWDVGAARVAAEAAEQAGMLCAGPVVCGNGSDGHQGRRLLQVRRPHSRSERELAKGHRLLGAGQEASAPTTRTPTGRSMRFRPPVRSSGPAWKTRWINGRPPRPAGRARRGARGQAREAQARTAHAGAAVDQGDHGRPDGRSRLRRAGRYLQAARRSRQGREGPGQGPQSQSQRPRAGVDLRGYADQPPEKGKGQPAAARAAVSRGHRRQGQARPVERNAQQVRDRGFSPPRRSSTPRMPSCTSIWA